jgi:hypothetical protein
MHLHLYMHACTHTGHTKLLFYGHTKKTDPGKTGECPSKVVQIAQKVNPDSVAQASRIPPQEYGGGRRGAQQL